VKICPQETDGAVRRAAVTVLCDIRAERSRFGGTARLIPLINREFTGKIGLKRAGDAHRASIHTEVSVGYPKIPATGNREFLEAEQRTSNGAARNVVPFSARLAPRLRNSSRPISCGG
jgi:hypothetical protein